MSTTVIPPKKAIDAFTLCRWKKNRNVRSRPMTQANPQMNNIWKSNWMNEKWFRANAPIMYLRYQWLISPCQTAAKLLGIERLCRIQPTPHRFLNESIAKLKPQLRYSNIGDSKFNNLNCRGRKKAEIFFAPRGQWLNSEQSLRHWREIIDGINNRICLS